jgi:hypothetical protein
MFYCEIDKTGLCFHATETELLLSDTIILSETNQFGKRYIDGEWVEVPVLEPETPEEPTQDELQWQAITDLEISQMEYNQALTDLEIKYLEGGINI